MIFVAQLLQQSGELSADAETNPPSARRKLCAYGSRRPIYASREMNFVNITQMNYKKYISGLKGFACVLIMLGHFLGLYRYAESFQSIPILDHIYSSRFSFVVSESYYLYLFFVISGYLVAKSNVNSVRDIIFKSVTRLFRLAFPIFFSYLVIFMIY